MLLRTLMIAGQRAIRIEAVIPSARTKTIIFSNID